MEAEAVRLFKAFYARSNDNAPEVKRRKKGDGCAGGGEDSHIVKEKRSREDGAAVVGLG